MTETQRIDPELDLLLRMRERLSDPDNWCQGLYEKDGATCLAGTYMWLKGTCWLHDVDAGSEAQRHVHRLLRLPSDESVPAFNDSSTHAQILERIDHAIAERTAELTA